MVIELITSDISYILLKSIIIYAPSIPTYLPTYLPYLSRNFKEFLIMFAEKLKQNAVQSLRSTATSLPEMGTKRT